MDVQGIKGFSEGLRAKLAAAGYTEEEQRYAALMAEMQAAMKLISNPLAAMAVSDTFAKAMALLTEGKSAPERICTASDIIFEAAIGETKRQLAELRGQHGDQVPGRRTVMTAELLDDEPAIDPKDIN